MAEGPRRGDPYLPDWETPEDRSEPGRGGWWDRYEGLFWFVVATVTVGALVLMFVAIHNGW